MKHTPARPRRLHRAVVTWLALVLATAGLVSLTPSPPAQAGGAQESGSLIAAVYNDTPFTLEYVHGWSEFGFKQKPTSVASEDAGVFDMWGSPIQRRGWCNNTWTNYYNGWFTYKVTPGLGAPEYITISIDGVKQAQWGVCGASEPTLEVFQTSSPPPLTWRRAFGPPPNQLTGSKFGYQHNTPYLFDQTITWNGEGPGVGVPTVVSLGDSTISGEGGRWAGNTNVLGSGRDDVGAQWYWDTPTGESITDCHRSKSALVHIGSHVRTKNLACSAAMTYSYNWDYAGRGWRFKPGLDKYCGGGAIPGWDCPGADKSQLINLYHYAKTHNVSEIVLAIGANDFDFSEIVQDCIKIYEEAHFLGDRGQSCSNSSAKLQENMSQANRAKVERDIHTALTNVAATMRSAGYDSDQYTVIVQNYWSPIASDEEIRIEDNLLDRQIQGGCPVLYGDATMLNRYLLPAMNTTVLRAARLFRSDPASPRVEFMDVSDALKGHRLCERGVGLIEEVPGFTGKGSDPTMVDKVEWVTEMRSLGAIVGEYTLAEGGHANYWGQLAERNCLRQLIHSTFSGGRCVPASGGGVNSHGEPNMTLTPITW